MCQKLVKISVSGTKSGKFPMFLLKTFVKRKLFRKLFVTLGSRGTGTPGGEGERRQVGKDEVPGSGAKGLRGPRGGFGLGGRYWGGKGRLLSADQLAVHKVQPVTKTETQLERAK